MEGIESGNAYSTVSLDDPGGAVDGPRSMLVAVGVDDVHLTQVELRESVRPLLDRLDPRAQQILVLRFFRNMSQSQIAAEVGISQMHVSRLLTKTLDELRVSLRTEG